MPHHVRDQVTVRPDSRTPYVLEFQYNGEISRRTDRGYYITTGGAFEVNADGVPVCEDGHPKLTEFGPFREDQLLPGWRNV